MSLCSPCSSPNRTSSHLPAFHIGTASPLPPGFRRLRGSHITHPNSPTALTRPLSGPYFPSCRSFSTGPRFPSAHQDSGSILRAALHPDAVLSPFPALLRGGLRVPPLCLENPRPPVTLSRRWAPLPSQGGFPRPNPTSIRAGVNRHRLLKHRHALILEAPHLSAFIAEKLLRTRQH